VLFGAAEGQKKRFRERPERASETGNNFDEDDEDDDQSSSPLRPSRDDGITRGRSASAVAGEASNAGG